MKVLITGVTSLKNRGVEALVIPLVEHLIASNPECQIEIASWTVEYDEDRLSNHKDHVRFVRDDFLRSGEWSQDRASSRVRSFPKRVKQKTLRKLGLLKDNYIIQNPRFLLPYTLPDLVIMSGGDLICSDYGSKALRHFLKPVHWAHAHNIPCALLGQSIGKFKTDEDTATWKAAEKIASLITVREPLTKDYLVQSLGSDPGKIYETADCAFLLSPDATLGSIYRTDRTLPLVGVSISESISKWTSADYEAHIDTWAFIATKILNEWGARIVMIPHVQDPATDDRVVSTKVLRKMKFDQRIDLLGGDLSAAEYKGVLSVCDMVIAERMHVSIGALSSGVPTVPIGYSIKAEGIITQIYQNSEINPLDSVIPMQDFLDASSAWTKLDAFWHRRDEYARFLASRLPSLKAMAKLNFDLMSKFM